MSPKATKEEFVGKIIYIRQNHNFGPHKIAMYLKRYHEIEGSFQFGIQGSMWSSDAFASQPWSSRSGSIS